QLAERARGAGGSGGAGAGALLPWVALGRGASSPGPDGDDALRAGAEEAKRLGDAEALFRIQHLRGLRALRAGSPEVARAAFDEALAVLRSVFSGIPDRDRAGFLQTPGRRRFSSDLLRLSAADGATASGGAARRVEAKLRGEEDLASFEKVVGALPEGESRGAAAKLRDRFRDLLRLQEVGMLLTAELDMDRLLALIMDRAIEIAGAERGFLLLLEAGRTQVAIARNLDREDIQRAEWKVSHGVAAEVARTGMPLVTGNAREDRRFDAYGSVHDLGLRSLLCVPLRVRGRVLGTLYLDNRFREGVFGPEAVGSVQSFADHAALALDNARLHREAARARDEVQDLNRKLADLNRDLRATVESQTVELDRTRLELRETRRAVAERFGRLVGRSPGMQELFRLLDRVAETDVPVLIEGESGTGKELAARAIHEKGRRAAKPFVSENCGAVPETLLESVLFGHVKGAFTGALADSPGLFVLAHGGTLFLDEVSAMSPAMQQSLLRVLQEGEVRPVGGREMRKVDVRIIAAANRPLADLVREGRFREDLFFRMNVVRVSIPPLRQRSEDVPLLIAHFLEVPERDLPNWVDPRALEKLMAYGWPGNVRELENVITRMKALGKGRIDESLVPAEILRSGSRAATPAAGAGIPLGTMTLDQIEEKVLGDAIRAALAEANGMKARAAEILGIPKSTLYNRMKKYGIGE
ncbi:MAG: sigma 54-interacting transcriptional regulator, partial [Planctomycetales bacterium]|nr:sigma 54-interacting transcriptional regulator [Planctomycetales bacterium]